MRAGEACVVSVAPWSFDKNGKASSFSGPRVMQYVCVAERRARQAMAVTVLRSRRWYL